MLDTGRLNDGICDATFGGSLLDAKLSFSDISSPVSVSPGFLPFQSVFFIHPIMEFTFLSHSINASVGILAITLLLPGPLANILLGRPCVLMHPISMASRYFFMPSASVHVLFSFLVTFLSWVNTSKECVLLLLGSVQATSLVSCFAHSCAMNSFLAAQLSISLFSTEKIVSSKSFSL